MRPLETADIPVCERILRGLPDWFGIEASNQQYIADLGGMPTLVAIVNGEIAGFLTLRHHNPSSSEIHCLAVNRALHWHGVGRAPLLEAEAGLIADGVRMLQVKTLGPSHPDAGYTRTRAFYLAVGFLPLKETTALWVEENPTLVMVKTLGWPWSRDLVAAKPPMLREHLVIEAPRTTASRPDSLVAAYPGRSACRNA